MKRSFSSILFLAIFGGGFFLSNAYLSAHEELSASSSQSAFFAEKLFVVEESDTVNAVREKLVIEGYIKSSTLFRFAQLISGSGTIEPGGYRISHEMSMFDIIHELTKPDYVWLLIPAGISKEEISKRIARALSWDEKTRKQFITAYTGIQWDAFNEELIDIFGGLFSWADTEKETFATMGAFFSDKEYDFLENYYVPKAYLVPRDVSRAQMANILVSEYKETYENNLKEKLAGDLDRRKAKNIEELVQGEVELIPDLISLAPYDLAVEWRNGVKSLVFSTTYWNAGKGPFELYADQKTRGIAGDLERDVYQIIERIDGDHREKLVGNFLWHDAHLHYHFKDFITYTLENTDLNIPASQRRISSTKATYCIRDVDIVESEFPDARQEPEYRICGKERQGISIGWGDSYYYTYADQSINLTELPSGTYKLSFHVNPNNLFEELSYENNESHAIFKLNVEAGTVEILETSKE
jgi:cell division protein YceG involved in septum cleavage